MLELIPVDLFDASAVSGFSDFFKRDGAAAALIEDGVKIGLCRITFLKDGALIREAAYKDGFDGDEYRRFFLRSVVLKLFKGGGVISSAFKDSMLTEMGFYDDGLGMKCAASSVKFPKMCELSRNKAGSLDGKA